MMQQIGKSMYDIPKGFLYIANHLILVQFGKKMNFLSFFTLFQWFQIKALKSKQIPSEFFFVHNWMKNAPEFMPKLI